MDTYFIDTHAHLDFDSFDKDRDSVINNYQASQVKKVINIAVSLETIKKSQSLATQYPHIYTSLGLHPSEISIFDTHSESEIFDLMIAQSHHPKIVGIGECGLDYFKIEGQKEQQQILFTIMIKVALHLGLPLIIHSREALDDVVKILKEQKFPFEKVVFHSWSYGPKEAQEILALGAFLAFNGIVTYKNATAVQEVAATVPENKFFLETDSPFLPPQGKRGQRNDPSNIPSIADSLAKLRNTTIETIAQQTTHNANSFFNLSK